MAYYVGSPRDVSLWKRKCASVFEIQTEASGTEHEPTHGDESFTSRIDHSRLN